MKKIITSIAIVSAITLSLNSCKQLIKASKSIKTEEKVDDSNSANEIISFNNSYLEEYKKKSNYLKDLDKYVTQSNDKAHGAEVYGIIPPTLKFTGVNLNEKTVVTDAFGKDKTSLEKDYKEFNDLFKQVTAKKEELESYMKAEDYKDDKGAKADALKKDIKGLSEQFYKVTDHLYTTLKPLADSAEEVTLKDHPLKKYILSSKKMLDVLDKVYDSLDEQYTNGKYDAAATDKLYSDLEVALKANQSLTFDDNNSETSGSKSSYERLNDDVKEFLDDLKKTSRDAKAEGKISEHNITTIDSQYESVISSYNYFVD